MASELLEETGATAERAAFLQRIAELEAHNRLLTEAAIERERRLQDLEAALKAARIELATIGPDNARHKAERDFLAGEMANLEAHNRQLTEAAVAGERRLQDLEAELKAARIELATIGPDNTRHKAERDVLAGEKAKLDAHNRQLAEAADARERRLQDLEDELNTARIELATIGPDHARHQAERNVLAGEMAELKAHNRLLTEAALTRERRLQVLEEELSKAQALQREKSPDPLLIMRRQLGYLIGRLITAKQSPVDVVYVGHDVARHAPPPPPAARVIQIVGAGEEGDFGIKVPAPGNGATTLVIYAMIDVLFRWTRLDEDLERYLDAWRHVGIALIVPGFQVVEFATHSYLLSILASSFPARKFTTTLEVFEAPQPLRPVPKGPLLQLLQLARHEAWPMLKRNWFVVSGGGGEPPARFSALVISVKPRR